MIPGYTALEGVRLPKPELKQPDPYPFNVAA